MATPMLPLMAFGALAAGGALAALGTEWMLRVFNKRGLSQGAVARKRGESFGDNQKRNLAYDRREVEILRRKRPLLAAVAVAGLAALIVGAVL